MMTDIEIAQAANPLKIGEIAQAAGVDEKYLEQYGNYKAKVDYNLLKETEGTVSYTHLPGTGKEESRGRVEGSGNHGSGEGNHGSCQRDDQSIGDFLQRNNRGESERKQGS